MNSSSELVEHFFRHEYGRLVALLTRDLGVRNLELAEDVVQSAMSRALVTWPRSGTPSDPTAWLFRTAKNLAIDSLRRQKLADEYSEAACSRSDDCSREPLRLLELDSEIGDETLRLFFLCCHPVIAIESQVALALKTVSGFGIHEIASGLQTSLATVEKRLSRAKEKLREHQLEFSDLSPTAIVERLPAVLSTIYLIFNEGYAASSGENAIRLDLCWEAIRLAKMVAAHPLCGSPEAHAFTALLLLHVARMYGRIDTNGLVVLLAEQDRARWDGGLIREAMAYAERAAQGTELSRFHLEAAIAWEHCRAVDFSQTDWSRIANLYEMLRQRFATPMIRLNAAVARSYVDGPLVGTKLLLELDDVDRKRIRPWWDCCMAQMYERLEQPEKALSHWTDASALAASEPQRIFIHRQMERLNRLK
ncbi:MAG: sigma-70 family RNA polymerase sigma factor [Planctomycetaceae bacterium]|nr:sigma-70 family RNA polymerase sigma factor [Planctomycetaceae bacterium]